MNEQRSLIARFSGLATAALCVAAVWLILLPWLASQPAIFSRLVFLEQRGIDPSAMFYTELDAMDPILDRIENRTSKHNSRTRKEQQQEKLP